MISSTFFFFFILFCIGWNMRKESNDFIVSLPIFFSFSISSLFHLMRSFRRDAILYRSRERERERDRTTCYSIMHGIAIELKEITGGMTVMKGRFDTSRQLVVVDDLSMLIYICIYERHIQSRQTQSISFFVLYCSRHLATAVPTTAAFRHRMMNTITKSDDYIIISIKITSEWLIDPYNRSIFS